MLEGSVVIPAADPAPLRRSHALIDSALQAARDYLEMAVSYLSEFVGGDVVIRHVDRGDGAPGMRVGDRLPWADAYCRHILEGRLPPIIADTGASAFCRGLRATSLAGIGSHVGVPVRRPDGSVYGMFSSFSPDPHPTLNGRDLKVMRMFAAQAEEQVGHDLLQDALFDDAATRVRTMLRERAFDVVYQPIYRLADGGLIGFEALTRFRSDPYRSPDRWFADAAVAGMQADLEIMVIEAALASLPALPRGARLAVNASADTVSSGRLGAPFERHGPGRLTLEITEHARPSDPRALRRAIEALRADGAVVAIDDVGAGYSGLHQILKLRPDILKLDMSLVRDVDLDPVRRALASAMASFAAGTGTLMTAEGIERIEEYETLRALGIDHGQGWLLGRPGPLDVAASLAPISPVIAARASRAQGGA